MMNQMSRKLPMLWCYTFAALTLPTFFAADLDRVRIEHLSWNIFDDNDVIKTPVLPIPSPAIALFPTDHKVIRHFGHMAEIASNATLANIVGIRVISIH